MQLSLPFETPDLRKSPIKDAPADPSTYVRKSPPRMISADLPTGTQAAFLAAAKNAAALGKPLNRLLTIRWRSLFCDNGVNPLRVLPTAERIDHITELLRKWFIRNSLPPFYIWVRENADNAGEHVHITFHCTHRLNKPLKHYIARITGEPPARRAGHQAKTEGELARGELSSWHLAKDTQPERQGFYLAAYLGKGEPSELPFRGKLVANRKKPLRGISFGGSYKDGEYDITQGLIEGTASRSKRFFIANALKREASLTKKKSTARGARAPSEFIANPTVLQRCLCKKVADCAGNKPTTNLGNAADRALNPRRDLKNCRFP